MKRTLSIPLCSSSSPVTLHLPFRRAIRPTDRVALAPLPNICRDTLRQWWTSELVINLTRRLSPIVVLIVLV